MALNGETIPIEFDLTLDEAATLTDGDVTFTVTKPDGTTLSPALTHAVLPNGQNSTLMTLRAVLPVTAGLWTVRPRIVLGDRVISRPQSYFATWTDVSGELRSVRRLNASAEQLADSDIDAELAAEASRILAPYGVAYGDIEAGDQAHFDRAVGLFVAARLRASTLLNSNSGQGAIVEEQAGDVRIKYGGSGANTAKSARTIEESWESEARRWLLLVSFIRDANINRANRLSQQASPGERTNANCGVRYWR